MARDLSQIERSLNSLDPFVASQRTRPDARLVSAVPQVPQAEVESPLYPHLDTLAAGHEVGTGTVVPPLLGLPYTTPVPTPDACTGPLPPSEGGVSSAPPRSTSTSCQSFSLMVPAINDPGAPKYIFGGYNMSDIARGTGLALSTISKIFSGKRALTMRSAKKIADVLAISVDEVIKLVESYIDQQKRQN